MNTVASPVFPSLVALKRIRPSPTNPREVFDDERQKQLAETIQEHGVLQPLLLRPWPGEEGAYECVDGHRRLKAAVAAGLFEVPVRVQDLTTRQVIAIQLVCGENSEPLTALEEAAGFRQALAAKDDAGAALYTVDALAQQTRRHPNYIHLRLSLLKLPAQVRKLIAAQTLPVSTAQLLTRIPDDKDRMEAVEAILPTKERTEPLTFRDAEALIRERWSVGLQQAPFALADATLPGPEGEPRACIGCPHHVETGKNRVCTLPRCFRGKCNAVWDRASEKAQATGQRVLSEEEAAEVFEKHSPTVQIAYNSAYVDVNARVSYRHAKDEVEEKSLPTWRELLAEAEAKKGIAVPVCLARDRTGKQWELVQAALAIEAAKAIGEDMFKRVKADETLGAKDRVDRDAVAKAVRGSKEFTQRKKAEDAATKAKLTEGIEGLRRLHRGLGMVPPEEQWRIFDALLDSALVLAGTDGVTMVAKMLGVDATAADVRGWAAKALGPHRTALVPVLLVSTAVKWNGLKAEGFAALEALIEPPAKPVTDAKVLAEWVKAAAGGMPEEEIARSYGVPVEDVRGALGGRATSAAATKASPDKEAEVRVLRAAGKTETEIFIATKMPKRALRALLKTIDAEKGNP